MISKISSGANAALLVGALIAAAAFTSHYLKHRRLPIEEKAPSAEYMFALIAIGMMLTAALRGNFLPYFIGAALGVPASENPWMPPEWVAIVLLLIAAGVSAGHAKYEAERRLGRAWWVYIAGVILAVFLGVAFIPGWL